MSKFFQHFPRLTQREFLNRVRDRSNLWMNFLVPAVLAVLISLLLRYSSDGPYDFSENMNILPFLFMSIIISIFLGLTNSANTIVRDRTILFRERLMGVSSMGYFFAKLLILALFLLIQVLIFIILTHLILEIRGMFWHYFGYMYVSALIGISIGLLISIISRNSVVAFNAVPLILIPQIIFGGALVHFENMNRLLKFEKERPIPEFCEFIPSRWAVEGLFVAQAFKNRYHQSEKIRDHYRQLWQRCKENCRQLNEGEDCREVQCADLKSEYLRLRDETNKLIPYSNSYLFSAITFDYEENELENNKSMMYYAKFLTEHKIFNHKVVDTVRFNYFVLALYLIIINLINVVLLKFKLMHSYQSRG